MVKGSLKIYLVSGDLYINAKERFVFLMEQSPSV